MTERKKNHPIELEFQKDTLDLKKIGPFGRNSRFPIVNSIFGVRGNTCFIKIFAANSATMLVSFFLYRYICNFSKVPASADTSFILLQVVIGIKYITGTLVCLPFQWSSKQACAAFIAGDLLVLLFTGLFNLPWILSLCIFIFQVVLTFLGKGSRKKGRAPAIELIKTIQPVISFPQNKLVKDLKPHLS